MQGFQPARIAATLAKTINARNFTAADIARDALAIFEAQQKALKATKNKGSAAPMAKEAAEIAARYGIVVVRGDGGTLDLRMAKCARTGAGRHTIRSK
jgi:hypothetical protein